MVSPFSAYPAPLRRGIERHDPTTMPADLNPTEFALLQLQPPAALISAHSATHLVSFANHLRQLIDSPVHKVQTLQGPFYSVLGVAVFFKKPDGTFLTATWDRADDRVHDTLQAFSPWDTPILDFPRTDLWQVMLKEVLAREARKRINDVSLASRWSDWAWSTLEAQIINRIDLRRLKSKVRRGLELDWRAVSLTRKSRRMTGCGAPSVNAYNFFRQERSAREELWSISPLLMVLWGGIDLPSGAAVELEPAARLKLACAELGIKPAQWKLLANPKSPLAPLLRSFYQEFIGTWHRDPVVDFLGVMRILQPTKMLDLSVWRLILSMVGTRDDPPYSYAEILQLVAEPLKHVVRLIERGACPKDSQRRDAELHLICEWIADQGVQTISSPQRKRGWQFLLTKAQEYSRARKHRLELEGMHWIAPIHPITVGAFTAVPLLSGAQLWEESIDMNHCADGYGEACTDGRVLIMSVRLTDGSRYATLALQLWDGDWSLLQACGPGNRKLGSELEELIGTVVCLLNALRSASRASATGPRYRVYVFSNYDREDNWTEGVYFSPDAAIAAAKGLIRSCINSSGATGRTEWLDFGETPIIEALGGAAAAAFSASDYVAKICFGNSENFKGEGDEQ